VGGDVGVCQAGGDLVFVRLVIWCLLGEKWIGVG